MSHILAIDQGTTSSRALVFAPDMRVCGLGQQEITQHFPAPGHVEHDPAEIWETTRATARAALDQAGVGADRIAGIGITNQRETTVVWERATGRPIHRAIVWQDRRTAPACDALREAGCEAAMTAATGLLLDPYFSATKIAWMLDNVPGARARAEAGELLFGTIDCYLIWQLTGGRVHATDATNASRTALYDIRKGCWSADMCAMFGVPMAMLPDVRDCAAEFGTTDPALFGCAIPIRGVAGDQQAAAMGQACFSPGMVKATYGTGCFALLNTGATPVRSENRLLTTVASRLDGRMIYALEGSIFVAGAVVQWLRDELGIITEAKQVQPLAETADPDQQVIMVPAFTGLGAPHWQPDCRGAIFGLARNSGPAELARAALESVGFQTRDLLDAMAADWPDGGRGAVLRVDGGMSASDMAMQFLADITGAPVDRPAGLETTALGAAWLAGRQAGIWPDEAGFAEQWQLERRFQPGRDAGWRQHRHARWQRAVAAAMTV
ncbi:glycerol kinase GlpK [Roseovarius amoyensis]|uniref:glycerol kinase GlpK n=1 Tax=Roseovarius amoyensis TaxID=2211448 RepID=UPI000DBE7B69|nr:glycerol kinase GlpK [Roseovarius amoyensis]